MEVTPAFYAHLTSSLMGLAQGKVAVVLEVIKYLKYFTLFVKIQ